MQTHTLKCDSNHFAKIQSRDKKFEIRFDDRGFQDGDTLVLLETKHPASLMKEDSGRFPLIYTGQACLRRVTHIMRGPIYGLDAGWVIMSID